MSAGEQPETSRLAILQRILGSHLTSRSRFDLLLFWGRNPGGWFDRGAIRPFTRLSRQEIEESLEELAAEGVIRCQRDGHMAYYALSQDVGIRRAVKELARLTPNERRYLLHQCLRRQSAEDKGEPDPPSGNALGKATEGAVP